METPTIIAICSLITSITAVFLSGFLAPRFNAYFEKKYQDRKILKKTLRTLLEVEAYVHRKLPHPMISDVSGVMSDKIKELNLVSEEQQSDIVAGLPQFFQLLQPHIVEAIPDRFEKIDKEYNAVLEELATVDPILAFQISEKHLIVNPINQLNSLAVDLLGKFGINAEETDLQLINQLANPFSNKITTELQNDIRTAILEVAERISKKTKKEMELYFQKNKSSRKEDFKQLLDNMIEIAPKKNESEISGKKSKNKPKKTE